MRDKSRDNIDDFLAQKRLALVGVSRNPKEFSHQMFVQLRRRGYDMVPVNPYATEVAGVQCFTRLQDVTPPVQGALVMTPAPQSEGVVRDCAQAGISRVWLHRGAGTGSVSWEAVDYCRKQGISVVAGYCPYMFLPKTQLVHSIHAFFMKLGGSYPNHSRPRG